MLNVLRWLRFFESATTERSTSVSAPLPGELPKTEGEAVAVYFSMNTASEPGDTRS